MPNSLLAVADYSSLEIGILGDLCARLFLDNQLLEAYDAQSRGEDIHSNNAREVFGKWLGWTVPAAVKVAGQTVLCTHAGERADAIPAKDFKKHPWGKVLRDNIKAVFYGLSYGKGAYGFSTLTNVDGIMIGETVAGQMVDALLSAVPGMRMWFQWVEEFVRANHGIYSLDGRWCDLSNEMTSGEEWQHRRAFRRAWNFPCQATGAGIIGDAMVRLAGCPEWKASGYQVVMQVHDELVSRGPEENVELAKALMRRHMMAASANGVRLMVGLQVSVGHGTNYFEAK